LKIRKSSQLFRLRTAAEVEQHLLFLNSGPDQIPGVIIMRLDNFGSDRVADPYDQIIVIFNASPGQIEVGIPEYAGTAFQLHPVQAASSDPLLAQTEFDEATGVFSVPPRTTGVFVLETKASSQAAPTATILPTRQPTATPAPPPTAIPTQVPTALPTATPAVAEATSSPVVPIVVGGAIVIVAAVVGLFVYRRRSQ
jgi:pullulanase